MVIFVVVVVVVVVVVIVVTVVVVVVDVEDAVVVIAVAVVVAAVDWTVVDAALLVPHWPEPGARPFRQSFSARSLAISEAKSARTLRMSTPLTNKCSVIKDMLCPAEVDMTRLS